MLNPNSSHDKDKNAGSTEDGRKGSYLASALNKSGLNKDQVLISNNIDLKKPVIDFVDMEQDK